MNNCGACHGASVATSRVHWWGMSRRLPAIGTDRGRVDSYTYDLAVKSSNAVCGLWRELRRAQSQTALPTFRKTFGYANMPLDGLWLRAPYLHNGSVPTVRDLLEPPTSPCKVLSWQ